MKKLNQLITHFTIFLVKIFGQNNNNAIWLLHICAIVFVFTEAITNPTLLGSKITYTMLITSLSATVAYFIATSMNIKKSVTKLFKILDNIASESLNLFSYLLTIYIIIQRYGYINLNFLDYNLTMKVLHYGSVIAVGIFFFIKEINTEIIGKDENN